MQCATRTSLHSLRLAHVRGPSWFIQTRTNQRYQSAAFRQGKGPTSGQRVIQPDGLEAPLAQTRLTKLLIQFVLAR